MTSREIRSYPVPIHTSNGTVPWRTLVNASSMVSNVVTLTLHLYVGLERGDHGRFHVVGPVVDLQRRVLLRGEAVGDGFVARLDRPGDRAGRRGQPQRPRRDAAGAAPAGSPGSSAQPVRRVWPPSAARPAPTTNCRRPIPRWGRPPDLPGGIGLPSAREAAGSLGRRPRRVRCRSRTLTETEWPVKYALTTGFRLSEVEIPVMNNGISGTAAWRSHQAVRDGRARAPTCRP